MSSYTQVLVEKGLVTVEDIDTAERGSKLDYFLRGRAHALEEREVTGDVLNQVRIFRDASHLRGGMNRMNKSPNSLLLI